MVGFVRTNTIVDANHCATIRHICPFICELFPLSEIDNKVYLQYPSHTYRSQIKISVYLPVSCSVGATSPPSSLNVESLVSVPLAVAFNEVGLSEDYSHTLSSKEQLYSAFSSANSVSSTANRSSA